MRLYPDEGDDPDRGFGSSCDPAPRRMACAPTSEGRWVTRVMAHGDGAVVGGDRVMTYGTHATRTGGRSKRRPYDDGG